MELKRVVIGTAIVVGAALGGVWLFQLVPTTHAGLRQACLDAHDRSLVAAYIRLPEGMTAEEYQEMVRASCDCFARKAGQQLPQEDLAAYIRNQVTPELFAKIIAIRGQCGCQTP